jgi:hypothetical protein
MKLGFVIGIIIVALGLGVWLSQSSDEPAQNIEEMSEVMESQTEANQFNYGVEQSGDISEIMSLGQPVTCTFLTTGQGETNELQQSGTMYAGEGHLKVEVVLSGEVEGVAHSVIVDDTFYSWMEGATQGTMFDLSSVTIEDTAVETTNVNAEPDWLQNELEYTCAEWDFNQEIFELPATVEFLDMNQMMEENLQMLEEMEIDFDAFQLQAE